MNPTDLPVDFRAHPNDIGLSTLAATGEKEEPAGDWFT